MKKKDLENLRTKNITDLEKLVLEKRKETSISYSKIKAGQEKNVSKINNLRRDIAQILTIIREKEIISQLEEKGKR